MAVGTGVRVVVCVGVGPVAVSVGVAVTVRVAVALGDGVVDVLIKPGADLWVRVTPEAWLAAHQACR